MPSKQYEALFAKQMVRALHKRARLFAKRLLEREVERAVEHFGPGETAALDRAIGMAKASYEASLKKADLNLQTRLADIQARAGS